MKKITTSLLGLLVFLCTFTSVLVLSSPGKIKSPKAMVMSAVEKAIGEDISADNLGISEEDVECAASVVSSASTRVDDAAIGEALEAIKNGDVGALEELGRSILSEEEQSAIVTLGEKYSGIEELEALERELEYE